MAYSLCIIKDITPNKDDNLHYYYSSFAVYLATVKLNRTVATVSIDNYRINNGYAKVALSSTFTIAKARSATYLVEYESDASGYHMCYYVDDIVFQSGYVMYKLSIDYWGTYISHASFKHFLVDRANVDLNTYITGTYPTSECFIASTGQTIDNNSFTGDNVLLICQRKLHQTSDNDYDYNSIELYTCTLANALNGESQKSSVLTNILINLQYIAPSSAVTLIDNYKVNLLGAYLLPASFIANIDTSEDFTGKSTYKMIGAQPQYHNLLHVYAVGTGRYTNRYTIDTSTYAKTCEYFYGTYTDYIKIPKTTKTTANILTECNIDADNVTITLAVNETKRDITNAFKLCTSRTAIQASSDIASGVRSLSSVLQTGVSIASGNLTKVLLGMPAIASQVLKTGGTKPDTLYSAQGGAGSTYGSNLNGKPFKYTLLPYIENVDADINTYGIHYNNQVLSNLSYFLSATRFDTSKDYYIKAQAIGVDKVPLTARNVIMNDFNNGVFITELGAS